MIERKNNFLVRPFCSTQLLFKIYVSWIQSTFLIREKARSPKGIYFVHQTWSSVKEGRRCTTQDSRPRRSLTGTLRGVAAAAGLVLTAGLWQPVALFSYLPDDARTLVRGRGRFLRYPARLPALSAGRSFIPGRGGVGFARLLPLAPEPLTPVFF